MNIESYLKEQLSLFKDNKISINGLKSHISKFIVKESSNASKINSAINESHCVLILFDMGSRKSFENLLEEWLIFLREGCHYKGLVFIFGKHQDENQLLKTDEKEINEMIKVSEVECSFFNIADKSNEDINKIIDELIVNSVENAKNNQNKKDCFIF